MIINPQIQEKIQRLKRKDSISILFVCLGNICRSPAAEGVMRAIVDRNDASAYIHIDSAGTGNYHTGDLPDKRMRVHALRRGYNLTHRARQFRTADFDNFDIIIPMDASNLSNILRLARSGEDEQKVIPISNFFRDTSRYDYVPDPYYEGAEGFELVLDLLEDSLQNLFDPLQK